MSRQSNQMRVLLIVLAVAGAVAKSTASYGADEDDVMVVKDPRGLTYEPIPGMPPCATAAILRGNPRSGPAWVLLKLGSGCRVPWHWHTPNEDLVVISGEGTLSMRDGPQMQFVPGAYSFLPSGHAHQAECARSCLLFNSADDAFDLHYVDDQGEEISSEEALKRSALLPPPGAKPKPQPKAKPRPKAKK